MLPLSPPLHAAYWLQRRRRLAHWPREPSVRAARRRRHGAVQEQVRRAGGAAAVSGPVPLLSPLTPRCPAGTCSARWSRRTRGAGSASRTARWASPSETPSHGCTGITAWRAAPSPSQVRARRAAPGLQGPCGSAHRCVCPRSEVPERLHRDRAAALPQGLVPAAVLRAALRALPGEPRPALPLLPQHPARRRSGAPRVWGEDGALIIPATTPCWCSACDRHPSCVTNSNSFQQS